MTLTRRETLLALAGLTALAPAAQAQTRWQFATPYADGNLHTRNIKTFIQEIEQASAGRLAIQLHSNGSLLPMPQIKRGVQQGQVQLGEILLTAYAKLRGQRFRTFSPMTNRFATIIGANPTLVQSAELAQAFATGIVTAQITSAATGVDTSSWDYAKIFTPLGFSMTKNAVFVSRRAMEALPADIQALIRAAAVRAEARGYELSQESQTQAEATLAQRGMQVLPPSEQLLADLRRVSQQMTQEWIEKAGEDGKKLIDAYLAAR